LLPLELRLPELLTVRLLELDVLMSMRSAFTPAGGFSLERWMTPFSSTQR
jgi:hypothetical protein